MELACRVDWAAIGTWAAVVVALYFGLRESVWRYRSRKNARILAATSMIHGLQLCINNLRSLEPLLKRLGVGDRARLPELGKAILNPFVDSIRPWSRDASLFDEKTSSNIAYAVALIETIDKWGHHLTTINHAFVDQHWAEVSENAQFYGEAAAQAKESLDEALAVIRTFVPEHIILRRFGPEPTDQTEAPPPQSRPTDPPA